MYILISFLTFSYVFGTGTGTEPGIRIRVSKSGLDYADRIGAVLLNSAIRYAVIPDFNVDIQGGQGSITVKNIRLTDFKPLNYSYALHKPNALQWDTNGGSVTINGDWVAWYIIALKFWFNGQFSATVSDIQLSATVSAIKDLDDKPAVKILSCNAKIRSVSVYISGGFIPWLMNLFRDYIATAVKSTIENQVCIQARTVLIMVLNEKLKSLPTKMKLGSNFILDYSLYSDPIIGDSYVETFLNGSITWIDGSSVPVEGPPLPPVPSRLNRMVYVWGSDYVLNTFFQSAHIHNVSHVDVDRISLPTLGPYLRTTCARAVCVGNVSHIIRDRYPHRYTEMQLFTTSSPSANVTANGARLTATVRMNLYVEPRTDENLLIVFDIEFTGDLTVRADSTSNGTRLTGELTIDELKVHINKSMIGEISPIEIDLAVMLAKPFLQKVINQYLHTGVQVPTIPDVQLLNSQVTLMQRAIQVDGDMKYKNYTFDGLNDCI